jgi:hypothetical protein
MCFVVLPVFFFFFPSVIVFLGGRRLLQRRPGALLDLARPDAQLSPQHNTTAEIRGWNKTNGREKSGLSRCGWDQDGGSVIGLAYPAAL